MFLKVQLKLIFAEQAKNHYLNQSWPDLLTHIRGTRWGWVNASFYWNMSFLSHHYCCIRIIFDLLKSLLCHLGYHHDRRTLEPWTFVAITNKIIYGNMSYVSLQTWFLCVIYILIKRKLNLIAIFFIFYGDIYNICSLNHDLGILKNIFVQCLF